MNSSSKEQQFTGDFKMTDIHNALNNFKARHANTIKAHRSNNAATKLDIQAMLKAANATETKATESKGDIKESLKAFKAAHNNTINEHAAAI